MPDFELTQLIAVKRALARVSDAAQALTEVEQELRVLYTHKIDTALYAQAGEAANKVYELRQRLAEHPARDYGRE